MPGEPGADAAAVVQGEQWRFTVLAEGLIRLEWSGDGGFEDRASSFAVNRRLPVPAFEVRRSRRGLSLATARVRLDYDGGPFTPHGLTASLRHGPESSHAVWRFGVPVPNLGGTLRTLDEVDGRAALGPGVVSRRGLAVLDDSASLLFDGDGHPATRRPGGQDLYLFAYGRDYAEAVRALYQVSGPPPVLPRWALGNWWSRYHPYSAREYLELVTRFQAEGIPLSIAVLDMDWHLVHAVDPAHGSGWTGYTWDSELFSDPAAFLEDLHGKGLRATLNLHPADGVRSFEERYPEMAQALGRPGTGEPIEFDLTDPAFREAYFEVLLRPLEQQGVDFWWIDWQQGHYSRLAGVDPLWLLNHYHFLDAGKGGRRPLILSRYAGPGSHRYPVGFSGDTVISWASLDFQPEVTATAANVGYGWWSHDVGGHFGGARDDELTLRWVQLGVFSPILRLHSSENPFLAKEPWAFGPDVRAALQDALRLRHRLVPYLHTMNHRASAEGLPLVRPMYHLYPNDDHAYAVPNQFAFGTAMIVAPITAPHDAVTLMGAVRAWLPAGTWTDFFTGVSYDGGGEMTLHRGRGSIPVLLRAGAIVPLAGAADLEADKNPAHLEVIVAPGADGSFVLVEDNGTGGGLAPVPAAATPITWDQARGALTIGPATGRGDVVPRTRTWTITLLAAAGEVWVDGQRRPVSAASGRVSVTAAAVPTDRALGVAFGPGLTPRTADVRERLYQVLSQAHCGHEAKRAAWDTLRDGADGVVTLARLQSGPAPRPPQCHHRAAGGADLMPVEALCRWSAGLPRGAGSGRPPEGLEGVGRPLGHPSGQGSRSGTQCRLRERWAGC